MFFITSRLQDDVFAFKVKKKSETRTRQVYVFMYLKRTEEEKNPTVIFFLGGGVTLARLSDRNVYAPKWGLLQRRVLLTYKLALKNLSFL